MVVHFLLEQGGFDGGITGETPVRGGELVDQVGFGLALGAEMVEVVAEVGLVLFFGLVLEDDDAGGESVGEGVTGRGELAFGGFRAVDLAPLARAASFFSAHNGHERPVRAGAGEVGMVDIRVSF